MKFHLWSDPTANFHSYAPFYGNQMEPKYARRSAAAFLGVRWVYWSDRDAGQITSQAPRTTGLFAPQFTWASSPVMYLPPAELPAYSVLPGASGAPLRGQRVGPNAALVHDYCRDPKRYSPPAPNAGRRQ
ncbi:hypothetical protein HPP92_029118 [Vanilla planifolia]|uniref:Uncharacterized protein n=1 Tax=Vanilla planifolia TaxID=51239 RepID=A0A835P5G8_VANPL|nr:hypothetical protein HPP92_029118 [Vanilla planifolia]KAG0445891.1 hypothetical protein HPP92_029106 [Vanilla planifolia]